MEDLITQHLRDLGLDFIVEDVGPGDRRVAVLAPVECAADVIRLLDLLFAKAGLRRVDVEES